MYISKNMTSPNDFDISNCNSIIPFHATLAHPVVPQYVYLTFVGPPNDFEFSIISFHFMTSTNDFEFSIISFHFMLTMATT
jgi:hypothetical protein